MTPHQSSDEAAAGEGHCGPMLYSYSLYQVNGGRHSKGSGCVQVQQQQQCLTERATFACLHEQQRRLELISFLWTLQ